MAYLLIVDDDEDFATATAAMLQTDGHEVKIELDIKNAEKSIIEKRPDLIILDVMFPENSTAGFTFARTLKHYSEKLDDIPILMLTAVNEKFPLGFSSRDIDDNWLPVEEFIEKPVDFSVLLKKVSMMLSSEKSG